jgi:hypothetical protein
MLPRVSAGVIAAISQYRAMAFSLVKLVGSIEGSWFTTLASLLCSLIEEGFQKASWGLLCKWLILRDDQRTECVFQKQKVVDLPDLPDRCLEDELHPHPALGESGNDQAEVMELICPADLG